MNISYRNSDAAWGGYEGYLSELITRLKPRGVLELGAGANPTFDRTFATGHALDYSILDISATELNKAPDGYRKIEADISAPKIRLDCEFDLVFSRMLAEHLPDGEVFHRNVLDLLSPGGHAFHFFPTLFAPPFVANLLLPEQLSESLLRLVQRGREQEGMHAKFPARYSWCRGPTKGQLERLKKVGYTVEEYIGFFGHSGYYEKFPPAKRLHEAISNWFMRHPVPQLTSFAYLLLRKPS
jgi:SAM-dependent methyltransferase